MRILIGPFLSPRELHEVDEHGARPRVVPAAHQIRGHIRMLVIVRFDVETRLIPKGFVVAARHEIDDEALIVRDERQG